MAPLIAWLKGLALALLVVASAACGNRGSVSGQVGQGELPAFWRVESISAGSLAAPVIVLRREAVLGPALFRLLVIPGSGCTGFASFAERYFRGLRHAQVVVLHKAHADLFAGPAPAACTPAFVAHDALGNWRDDALAAVRQLDSGAAMSLPTLVLGISEGGEIAPHLLPALGRPMGMVLLSASGLDPALAGELQAERLGQRAAWQGLRERAASDAPDTAIVEGRSLRYWRDLFAWKLTDVLGASGLAVLRVWGSDDAMVPQGAYAALRSLPAARNLRLCDWRLPDADHGLQGPHGDGIQLLWPHLERWAASGQLECPDDPFQRL